MAGKDSLGRVGEIWEGKAVKVRRGQEGDTREAGEPESNLS